MSIRLTPVTPSRLCCGRSRRLGLEPVSHAGFGQQVAGAGRVGFQLARVGAVLAGRKTYDDSNGFPGGGPPPNAQLFVLTHAVPAEAPSVPRPIFVTDGMLAALSQAKKAAA